MPESNFLPTKRHDLHLVQSDKEHSSFTIQESACSRGRLSHLHYALLRPLPKLHVLAKQKPGVEGRLQAVAADDQPALDNGSFGVARAFGIGQPRGEYPLQFNDLSARNAGNQKSKSALIERRHAHNQLTDQTKQTSTKTIVAPDPQMLLKLLHLGHPHPPLPKSNKQQGGIHHIKDSVQVPFPVVSLGPPRFFRPLGCPATPVTISQF